MCVYAYIHTNIYTYGRKGDDKRNNETLTISMQCKLLVLFDVIHRLQAAYKELVASVRVQVVDRQLPEKSDTFDLRATSPVSAH